MRPSPDRGLALIGDVGGTNARLALADVTQAAPVIGSARLLACADFPDFQALLAAYLADLPCWPADAVIAVAATLRGGRGDFANLDWHVSEAALVAMGFKRPRLINDFHALALACPALGGDQLRSVGGAMPGIANASLAVIGAGTGFGAAALVRDGGVAVAGASEGGHIGFAPADEIEMAILRHLMGRFERVSVERILSGPGLVNLYGALAAIDGMDAPLADPQSIVAAAKAEPGLARRTVERFCRIFGSVAGDFVLAHGAWGGLYLNGAIVNSLYDELNAGGFRRRFEAKGRMSAYLRETPVQMIAPTDAALQGAARLAADLARS